MTSVTESAPPNVRLFYLTARAWQLAGHAAVDQIAAATGRRLDDLRVPAVERFVAALSDTERAGLWAELHEAHLATGDGVLTDAWAAAIVESALAPIALRQVSGHDNLVFVTDVTIVGERGLAVTRRRLGQDAGANSLLAADDVHVEVALFAARATWPMLRRGLPPMADLRADPWPLALDEAATSLDVATQEAYLDALYRASALETPGQILAGLDDLSLDAPAFADALEPVASVHLVVAARPRGADRVGVAIRSWVLGRAGLYAVQVRPEVGPVLVQASPGAVASEAIWLLTGAVEFLGDGAGAAQ